jgi:hypothetical protein
LGFLKAGKRATTPLRSVAEKVPSEAWERET